MMQNFSDSSVYNYNTDTLHVTISIMTVWVTLHSSIHKLHASCSNMLVAYRVVIIQGYIAWKWNLVLHAHIACHRQPQQGTYIPHIAKHTKTDTSLM